ncbi:MAG TPA: hypothetical protein VFQ74_07690 [Pseudolysinimonas sp.]|nr:hypothetical protein [Pseudolysinimonas sp.]
MLTAEDLKVALASAPLRQAHRLELPPGSLSTLADDPGAFATFYQQWTAQGQPPYVPPVQTAVQDAALAPVAEPAPTPPVPAPPAPAMAASPPVPVPPSPFGPPPTPPVTQQFSPYSRDPSGVAAFAGGSTASSYASPYSSPYSSANYLNSPNAVAPAGLARPGMTMMLWGFGVAIVGVVITGVTWATAAPGGTFVVAWGAILFGTIRGIIGLVRVTRGN